MRNYSIDILKAISAFAVVLIHLKTPYTQYYLPLLVFAVPVFFMISGYLLYNDSIDKMKRGIIRRIVKTFLLFLFSSIVYIIYNRPDINLITIIQILVFNLPDYAEHLWYLPAYIYVLIIVYLCLLFSRLKFLNYLVPLLLIIGFCMSSYSVLLFGRLFPPFFSRNFLFAGLPYLTIGLIIRSNNQKFIFKKKYITMVLVLSLVTSVIEHYFLSINNLIGSRINSISVFVIAVSIMLLSINVQLQSPNWLAYVGEKHSLNIYVFHPLVYCLLRTFIYNDWLCIIGVILLIIIGGSAFSFFIRIVSRLLIFHE